MTPRTENPPRAGGGLEIVHPDGLVTRSGSYRADALAAADEALRAAALDAEWAMHALTALLRDHEGDDHDLGVLSARCELLEAEARLGRCHIAVRRLRGTA